MKTASVKTYYFDGFCELIEGDEIQFKSLSDGTIELYSDNEWFMDMTSSQFDIYFN